MPFQSATFEGKVAAATEHCRTLHHDDEDKTLEDNDKGNEPKQCDRHDQGNSEGHDDEDKLLDDNDTCKEPTQGDRHDKGKREGHDEGKDKEHDLPQAPPKRQRIPRAMLLQIEDTDWGTSLSRLRHQLHDYSPLYPEGLSSESSDSTDEEEEETREGRTSSIRSFRSFH